MTKTTLITEEAMLYRLQCPLRADGSGSRPESPVLHCTESMARWLIDENAAGRQPTEGETHEFFDVQWQQTEFFRSRDAISPNDYNHQVEEGVLACSCVGDLIRRCDILQPISPYELTVDGITITGEYAVLHSRRRKIETFIPYFRYERVKPRQVIPPDVVTVARWMHAFNELPMTVSILHCLVNQNMAAVWQPAFLSASQFLRGMVGAIARPYPRAGEHCLTCPTRNCRPFFEEFPYEPPMRRLIFR